LILAGKGHNGDDARATREFLTDRRVETLDVIAPESELPGLEQALSQKPALIIDGLFGIGLDRPLPTIGKKSSRQSTGRKSQFWRWTCPPA